MLALIWNKFKGGIILALSIIAAVVSIYYKGKNDKKNEIEAEQSKKRVEDLKEVKKIDEKVNQYSDDQLDHTLDKWMRDKR